LAEISNLEVSIIQPLADQSIFESNAGTLFEKGGLAEIENYSHIYHDPIIEKFD